MDDDVTFIWALDDDVTFRRALDDEVTFRKALDDEVTFRRTFGLQYLQNCNPKVSVVFILSESKRPRDFHFI